MLGAIESLKIITHDISHPNKEPLIMNDGLVIFNNPTDDSNSSWEYVDMEDIDSQLLDIIKTNYPEFYAKFVVQLAEKLL
jgi:hypothetical protein